jgi:hypothetical protein
LGTTGKRGGPKRSIEAGIEQLADNASLELQATDGGQAVEIQAFARPHPLRSASSAYSDPLSGMLSKMPCAAISTRSPADCQPKALRRASERPSDIQQG